ncbi:hypothetical protein [Leptospirillum ferriphilum]|uniref:hypothetical protein n=1 Tax=Leptospirillum ferriphilum TaxID=178606 RepID=UPI001364B0C3|nr:hypothetical protein [Leptospirillum ferriphilum]
MDVIGTREKKKGQNRRASRKTEQTKVRKDHVCGEFARDLGEKVEGGERMMAF